MSSIAYALVYLLEKVWGRFFTDFLFFQSEEDYKLAVEKRFNKVERLIHIGNGVSPVVFNPNLYNRQQLRQRMGFAEKDVVLMFVGRLVREKGIAELIEAYCLLKGNHPNLKLMLVGASIEGDRGAVDTNHLVDSISASHKRDICFLGFRNDIAQLLSAADIFVLPSYREGLPRSVIEAMAMAKPVIATNIRGCREEVGHGTNGYLCQVKNSGDLARCITMLMEDPQKIVEFGLNSRNIFLSRYDEQRVLEKQLAVYRTIGS